MVEIPLPGGMVALIDDADLPIVSGMMWRAKRRKVRSTGGDRWYAIGSLPRNGRRGPHVRMHRLILPGAPLIDHKNGNGLDNRRENIRPATVTQNHANRAKTHGKSRYKGVVWAPHWSKNGNWRAVVQHDRRKHYLGYFQSEGEAASAYNVAAVRLFGEFARLNIVPVAQGA